MTMMMCLTLLMFPSAPAGAAPSMRVARGTSHAVQRLVNNCMSTLLSAVHYTEELRKPDERSVKIRLVSPQRYEKNAVSPSSIATLTQIKCLFLLRQPHARPVLRATGSMIGLRLVGIRP